MGDQTRLTRFTICYIPQPSIVRLKNAFQNWKWDILAIQLNKTLKSQKRKQPGAFTDPLAKPYLKQQMTMLQVPDLRAIHVNPFLNNSYRILFLIHAFTIYFTQDCYQPYRRQGGILNLQMRSLRTANNITNFPEVPWGVHQSMGRSLLPLLCLTPDLPVMWTHSCSMWIRSCNYVGPTDS